MHGSTHLSTPPLKQDLSLCAGTVLIESTAVLPEQFFRVPTAALFSRGEFALMRAVFEDALLCFENQFFIHNRQTLRLAREAEEWIYGNDERWPFSFLNICMALGLDPDYVRLQLTRRRQAATRPLRRKRRRVMSAQAPLSLAA